MSDGFIEYAREQYDSTDDPRLKRYWAYARMSWHEWWAHELKRLADEAVETGDWSALEHHTDVYLSR